MSKREKFLKHFPREYSDDIRSYADEVALRFSRYIFIEGKGKKRKAHCTYCKHDFEILPPVKHLSIEACPNCKGEYKVRLAGISRKYLEESAYFIYFEKSEQDSNVLIARGIYASRDYRYDFRQVETKFISQVYYTFELGVGGTMFSNPFASVEAWDKDCSPYWSFDASVYCRSSNTYLGNIPNSIARTSIIEAINGTPFQYIPWDENWDLIKFFNVASKYPRIVEYLMKCGFKGVVQDKMYDMPTYRTIDWKASKITDVMRLPLNVLREMTREEKDYDCRGLAKAQIAHKDKSGLDLSKVLWDISEMKSAMKYTKLQKLHNYLEKQKRPIRIGQDRRNRGHVVTGESSCTLSDWLDYVKDCKRLALDLKQESVLYPKSLYRAHQNTIKQVKYKEDKELDEKIKKLVGTKAFKGMCFEAMGYLIRPAVNTHEIIREGEALHHCVGGYADRHASGKLVILLLRKIDKPMEPFVTVEYREGAVKQMRGLRNCDPGKEVREFVTMYEHLLKKQNLAS